MLVGVNLLSLGPDISDVKILQLSGCTVHPRPLSHPAAGARIVAGFCFFFLIGG